MADPARSRSTRAWLPLAAAAALLVAGGMLVGTPSGDPEASRAGGSPAPARSTYVATTAARSGHPQPHEDGLRPGTVTVPALGVRAGVRPIAVHDGVLTPPSDPRTVGWWSGGSRPGAARGAAVLTGHTVHTGGGAFDDLEELEPGDQVVVGGRRTRLAYAVESVRVLGRSELARENERIFGRTGRSRLVLITCEDWDGTAYRSNVVVTARPLV